MADLLLELFSEEIPARMQRDALEHLKSNIVIKLQKEGVIPDHGWAPTGFVTPRRLAILMTDLPLEQAATEEELKGPKTNAPDAALQGFLKKTGLTKEQLSERDGIFFARLKKGGSNTADLLKTTIEDTLKTFPWPKSMAWGAGSTTWVRPLHNILCLFDGKVIPISFAGITANNITYGHRFLSPAAITITDPAQYETALEKAHVIPSRDKRKAEILRQANALLATGDWRLKTDEGLLEEVTGLVEYPTLLTGTIDAAFMDLPKEVLVSEMRAHQKYFALENADGTLANKFLITSNMTATDGGKAIIAGNERVLRARLSDGRFFWDQDRKKPLEEWAKNLETVTYHAKLGSIAGKVSRIAALAALIAETIGADKTKTARAAALCKADLTTGMVGEFPELQGVMGRYYATAAKEDASVADAIRDHYKPQGPSDAVPTEKTAIAVALADKLDTLISMFAIGEKPTGSKDPFALRRAALGVIRIILENNLRLPLKPLFAVCPTKDIAQRKAKDKLEHQVEETLKHPHQVGKYVTLNESAYEDFCTAVPEDLSDQLYDFFIDRLKVQLKDQGLRHDVVNAITAGGEDDLYRLVAKAKALQDFLNTDDGKNLLAGYTRAANILAIEQKKDGKTYSFKELNVGSLKEPAEKDLAALLPKTHAQLEQLQAAEKSTEAMILLASLRAPIDTFFDKILVNSDEPELRANRLHLLSGICESVQNIANFSLLEGDSKEPKQKAA